MAAARTTNARGGAKPAGKVAIPQVSWNQIRPAPVVLVSGPQGFLADRAMKSLREFLRAEDPALEVSDVAADGYTRGVLASLASPSLFGEPRLVRVSAVEKCSDDFLEDALHYLESPPEGATVILRHGGGVRGKKLLDAIRAAKGVALEVVCADLKKDAEKYEFAQAEFQLAGKSIRAAALRAIVAAFSDDLAELASACQQLIADTSDEITEATVAKYYGGRVETNAFSVADAAIAGRYGEALVGLRHALDSGADPVPIVAAFASKIRTMAKVSGAGGSTGDLARRFGLAPWQVERARRDLRGWTDESLGRTIQLVAETDAAVKGQGRDPVFALERMVTGIASRGRSLR